MSIFSNIVDTIGNTPIVRLNNLTKENDADVYVKLEYFNPGGSVKDRIAYNMILDAERKGLITKGSTIVEPTSGNTGIGLALVAAANGYKIILVMPETMSVERRQLLKILGAEIILTPGMKGMSGAVEKAREMAKENGYFIPLQFDNPANPEIHKKTTALEIVNDFVNRGLDYFVAGVGTGGTISGVGSILKNYFNSIKIIAVEPAASPVLSGGLMGPHKIQGIGAGFIPNIYDPDIVDEIIQVSNEDAIETAKKLARTQGILCGISSGAAAFAALSLAKENKSQNILTILPDTAERYLSTDLFKEFRDV
jgi:cysteine synthase